MTSRTGPTPATSTSSGTTPPRRPGRTPGPTTTTTPSPPSRCRSPGVDALDLAVDAQGRTEDGWDLRQSWHTGVVDPAGSVTVHGPPTLGAPEETVLVEVMTWGSDVGTDVFWTGLLRATDGVWETVDPVTGAGTGDLEVQVDLDTGTTTPASLGPEAEAAFWAGDEIVLPLDEAETDPQWEYSWADEHDDAAPALTLEVPDDVPPQTALWVSASLETDDGGWASQEWFSTSELRPGVLEVSGPPGLGSMADQTDAVEVIVSASAPEDHTEWSATVRADDGGWTRTDDAATGPIELVLDAPALGIRATDEEPTQADDEASGGGVPTPEATATAVPWDEEAGGWGQDTAFDYADEDDDAVVVLTGRVVGSEGPAELFVDSMTPISATAPDDQLDQAQFVGLRSGPVEADGTFVVHGPSALTAYGDVDGVEVTIEANDWDAGLASLDWQGVMRPGEDGAWELVRGTGDPVELLVDFGTTEIEVTAGWR